MASPCCIHHIPLMLSAGAAFITFNNSYNGGSGSSFNDGSPQVGFVVSPYYQLDKIVSLQAALRYMKGFAAGPESEAIDLSTVSLGLRLTIL